MVKLLLRMKRTSLVVAGAIAACALAGEPQSPSEVAKADPAKAESVTFVLVESRDLRLLFCTVEMLKDRQHRKVCVVDQIFGGPKEVPVAPGDTVRDVLKKIGKERMTSQVRLVTENAIEQTPLSVPPNRVEDFLSRRVSPGDILILAALT